MNQIITRGYGDTLQVITRGYAYAEVKIVSRDAGFRLIPHGAERKTQEWKGKIGILEGMTEILKGQLEARELLEKRICGTGLAYKVEKFLAEISLSARKMELIELIESKTEVQSDSGDVGITVSQLGDLESELTQVVVQEVKCGRYYRKRKHPAF